MIAIIFVLIALLCLSLGINMYLADVLRRQDAYAEEQSLELWADPEVHDD